MSIFNKGHRVRQVNPDSTFSGGGETSVHVGGISNKAVLAHVATTPVFGPLQSPKVCIIVQIHP